MRRDLGVITAACVAVMIGAPAEASSPPAAAWVAPGYDFANRNYNPSEKTITAQNVTNLHRVWRTPPINGASSPLVVGQTAYAITNANLRNGGSLVAINITNGAIRWRTPLACPSELISFASGKVFVPSIVPATTKNCDPRFNQPSIVTAVNALTGKPAWHVSTGYEQYAPPTAAGSSVFTWDYADEILVARNISTGKALWSSPAASNPVVGANVLYLHTPDFKIAALNANGGSMLWSVGGYEDPPSAVDAAGGRLYLLHEPAVGGVAALSTHDGHLLWSNSMDGYAVGQNNIFGVCPNGTSDPSPPSCAVSPTDGHVQWTNYGFLGGYRLIAAGGVLYGSSQQGTQAYRASDGSWLGAVSVGASPVIANGRLFNACGSSLCAYAP